MVTIGTVVTVAVLPLATFGCAIIAAISRSSDLPESQTVTSIWYELHRCTMRFSSWLSVYIIGITVAVAVLQLAVTGCSIVVAVSRSSSVSSPTTVIPVQHVLELYGLGFFRVRIRSGSCKLESWSESGSCIHRVYQLESEKILLPYSFITLLTGPARFTGLS